MVTALFPFVLTADFALLLAVVISKLLPRFRIWPPPTKESWQQWVSWTLFTIGLFGVPAVGIIDFDSVGNSGFPQLLIGWSAILVGFFFVLWATVLLSSQQSMGTTMRLISNGPYRYSRNPQYLAYTILLLGVILVTNSFSALITGILMILVFVILPFVEEPWLRQKFGRPYEEYCQRVPRFMGFRSLRQRSSIHAAT